MKTHALLLDRVLLPRWQRLAIYVATTALVVTGVIWWALDFGRGEAGAGATQVWSLRLHGFAAMLGLVFFGSLLSAHIRIGWALQRNRVMGVTLGSLTVVLALTGYGLYYLGGDTARYVSSTLHLIFGLLMPFTLWLHIRRGRASRRNLSVTHASATVVTATPLPIGYPAATESAAPLQGSKSC